MMSELMDGELVGWVDGWMDGWLDGWMDGWVIASWSLKACNPSTKSTIKFKNPQPLVMDPL